MELGLRAESCATDHLWQPTISAYEAAGVDTSLTKWWQQKISGPHGSFANELAKSFGKHPTDFECRIGHYNSCTLPACTDYQESNDSPWSYLSLVSTVNLNTYFNQVSTGITNGQTDFSNLTDNLSSFFPAPKLRLNFGDAAFYITATVSSLFLYAVPLVESLQGTIMPTEQAHLSGIGAFGSAAIQNASYLLAPDPDRRIQTVDDLATLDSYTVNISKTATQRIQDWSNSTFYGLPDNQGKNIIDYLSHGSFVELDKFLTDADFGRYYKNQMIARVVNSQWRMGKVYVIFKQTEDRNDNSGPNTTYWYSENDKGIYYTYRYQEDGILRGHLEKPWGLDLLFSIYGISGDDITKSSARAWKISRYNFTQENAFEQIQNAVLSNGTLTPYQDGPGWIGTFTLPVCNISTHPWTTQFGYSGSRYGMLPCCCGTDCKDTKDFVKAANMHGFQTLLWGCEAQLKGTDLQIKSIDYGFKRKYTLPLVWATWAPWQKALFVLGIIITPSSLLGLGCHFC